MASASGSEAGTSEPDAAAPDAAAIEALERFRHSGISLDREGRFWHEGEEIAHEGMRRTFHRWVDRLDDGRYVLRLDDKRYVYLEVEDLPVVIKSLRWDGDRAFVKLPDEREEELDYAALRLRADGSAVTAVKQGRLGARLSPGAWSVLAERIESEGGDQAVLRAAGTRFTLHTA